MALKMTIRDEGGDLLYTTYYRHNIQRMLIPQLLHVGNDHLQDAWFNPKLQTII